MKNEATTKEQVLEAIDKNHIWINAFTLINPSDDTVMGIGRSIVNMLKKKENLLPSYIGDISDRSEETKEALIGLSRCTPTLYLHINAS